MLDFTIMSSSDIIFHLKEYDKGLQELQNAPLLYVDKYLSLFNKLDAIELSEDSVQEKHKKLEELQKEFNEIEKQIKSYKDENDKKIKDTKQRESFYISSALKMDNCDDKLMDVLKSGALKYEYAVKLIKNNDAIKQQIRNGKYIIARKGDHVALLSTDKDVIGNKQGLTRFLQQYADVKISDVILSNVPVYNDGSKVLSFEKDAIHIQDNVLKIYFSIEDVDGKSKINGDMVCDVIKQVMEYQNSIDVNQKINVSTECSSYGIDPLLKGLLSAKYSDTHKCLSLKDGRLNISLIPRGFVNGVKPEDTAKKVDELYHLAIMDGYGVKDKNKPFINMDVLSNDTFGRFSYHDIGSTNSFLKELGKLQQKHNGDLLSGEQQKLFVAFNDDLQQDIKKDMGIFDKSLSFLTGTAKKDLFTNINKNNDIYRGITVSAMNDIANRMDNKDASVNKSNKDGVLHNVVNDKTPTNDPAKPMAINKTELKHV